MSDPFYYDPSMDEAMRALSGAYFGNTVNHPEAPEKSHMLADTVGGAALVAYEDDGEY